MKGGFIARMGFGLNEKVKETTGHFQNEFIFLDRGKRDLNNSPKTNK
ncbi:hypothetical protein [Neobacillus niacini]|nr:hypothetical protein [Neobacillus niacini]